VGGPDGGGDEVGPDPVVDAGPPGGAEAGAVEAGKPDQLNVSDKGDGCGCRLGGGERPGGFALLAVLSVMPFLALLRRRRRDDRLIR
jgi:hypothetical protein